MRYNDNRKNEAGFTLLELLLVVGVGAILLLAGIATYRLVTAGNNINEANKLVQTIKQQVQRLYQGQTSYGTANITANLVNAGIFPASALNGTTPVTPWNSNITVTGATNTFTIQFAALPEDACIQLATTDLGDDPDFVDITVGTTVSTVTPTLAAADTACGASTAILWEFF